MTSALDYDLTTRRRLGPAPEGAAGRASRHGVIRRSEWSVRSAGTRRGLSDPDAIRELRRSPHGREMLIRAVGHRPATHRPEIWAAGLSAVWRPLPAAGDED